MKGEETRKRGRMQKEWIDREGKGKKRKRKRERRTVTSSPPLDQTRSSEAAIGNGGTPKVRGHPRWAVEVEVKSVLDGVSDALPTRVS